MLTCTTRKGVDFFSEPHMGLPLQTPQCMFFHAFALISGFI